MAKEIDHRVTNSLQFISGLLMMQGRTSNSETASGLQMAANRVAAVAQVHRNFYTDEAEETSCITFLRRLCADLSGILGTPIEVQGDEGKVPTTRIQPIGLMLNELVTIEYNILEETSVCRNPVLTTQPKPNYFSRWWWVRRTWCGTILKPESTPEEASLTSAFSSTNLLRYPSARAIRR